jgi:lipopolysaccharide biosynthesis glycosyltransferase
MKLALATTLDDRYMRGFLLTFNSILSCTENFNYDLIVLDWGKLSDLNKKIINKLYDKVIFKKVDTKSYENHKFDDVFRQWNYNCNYRFDIFTLEYDKIIYFDCDMLFEISVNEIFKYDFDFGACQMPNYTSYDQVDGNKIFNAGLMLVGSKFLNENTKKKLIDIANTKPKMYKDWTGNQPILNKYFLDKMDWLPNHYNFLSEDLTVNFLSQKINYHFIGKNKPWNLDRKYDQYIISQISKNNNIILSRMIYKSIDEKFDNQILSLKEKGIDLDKLKSSFN